MKNNDYENSIMFIVGKLLCLEEDYNKLLRAEFDYYGNVKSYRINWETFDREKEKELTKEILLQKTLLKKRVWLWNYFLFSFTKNSFYKKFKNK